MILDRLFDKFSPSQHITLLMIKRIICKLNIYDTKTISCKDCSKVIGEIDYDAQVILPKCGQCSEPIPHFKDKMPYLIQH